MTMPVSSVCLLLASSLFGVADANCKACTRNKLYKGDCWSGSKKTNKWGNHFFAVNSNQPFDPDYNKCHKDSCCARNSDKCCETTSGVIAAFVIAAIVIVLCVIICCCYAVAGCPLHPDSRKPREEIPAPVEATVQSEGPVQGTIVASAPVEEPKV
mmetsp:Transcript_30439/g.94192  ORF Transcript_30439/g.94192 Transcript_30439/m.94192 type:complete len:156 (+) Transcript_30439:68-535(+)